MKFYYKISMNILLSFLNISHDTNPIHQQINAVIPGNLLVVLLEKIISNILTKRQLELRLFP